MILIYMVCRLAVFAMVFLIISPIVGSQQETGPKNAQPNIAESYPNTADGLHMLIDNLFLTARNQDEAKLEAQIAELTIPDYKNWFIRTFGQDRGEILAGTYGESLEVSKLHFAMLCTELTNHGEVSIEKVDTAKKYGMPADALDEYKANWKKTDESAGPDSQSIGDFFYVDGKFRLNRFVQEVRILSTNKSGPLVPAKLINRVEPVYPMLARQIRIQGTLSVNVIIRKDGSVTVQNVGAGHPLLAKTTVDAVQQWRYQPATINGEPVDVQTKVYVVFVLTKPHGEKK